jgi:hypothetical protein
MLQECYELYKAYGIAKDINKLVTGLVYLKWISETIMPKKKNQLRVEYIILEDIEFDEFSGYKLSEFGKKS